MTFWMEHTSSFFRRGGSALDFFRPWWISHCSVLRAYTHHLLQQVSFSSFRSGCHRLLWFHETYIPPPSPLIYLLASMYSISWELCWREYHIFILRNQLGMVGWLMLQIACALNHLLQFELWLQLWWIQNKHRFLLISLCTWHVCASRNAARYC